MLNLMNLIIFKFYNNGLDVILTTGEHLKIISKTQVSVKDFFWNKLSN